MLVGLYDTETNGLWPPQDGKSIATKMHSVGVFRSDGLVYWGSDDPIHRLGCEDVTLRNGKVLKRVVRCTNAVALQALEDCDLRVAHNGDSFDDRMLRHQFPWYAPRGASLDTLIVSRLLFPTISREGPNTHRVPSKLHSGALGKTSHSIEAWGWRLGNKKDKEFDPGDWQTYSEDMGIYMLQDIESMNPLFKYLMSLKPSQQAMEIEHGFAKIIRRQEVWGFTTDYAKLLSLQDKLETTKARLEKELIETFGCWWEPGKEKTVKATRRVKMPDYPDITLPRYGASGKRLPKDYVGPPLCHYPEGARYTPIEWVEFSPGSREHVRKMFQKKYGWRPTKFNKDSGSVVVDDDVLRALPYPEADKLADFYTCLKLSGYVSSGKNAWMLLAKEDLDGCYRMFGQVMTIGTYTFRCAHMKPNMGQIPSRNPEYGHLCRDLFTARPGFKLVGFDGSGMQLRLLAHYMAKYDGGKFATIMSEGDPHAFMRDICQQGLMDAGYELIPEDQDAKGREHGKTTNYALVFGGGDGKLGSIWRPHATLDQQRKIGGFIKAAMEERLTGYKELKAELKNIVEERGYLIGLDGRKAKVQKAHVALSTLLQMGEAVVMKKALVIMDGWLQEAGLRPGVDASGVAHPDQADYEFCANVHDEAQADVRPSALETYTELALKCVTQAGIDLRVKCPLKSDVKVGDSWASTH